VKARPLSQLPPDPREDIVPHHDIEQIQAPRLLVAVGAAAVEEENVARFQAVAEAAGDMDAGPGEDHRDLEELMAVLPHGRLAEFPPHRDRGVGTAEVITAGEDDGLGHNGRIML